MSTEGIVVVHSRLNKEAIGKWKRPDVLEFSIASYAMFLRSSPLSLSYTKVTRAPVGGSDAERRYNMSVDEAIALGIKAIRYSTLRDAYSGGFINVYLITPRDGWQRVFTEDPDQMMASMAEQSVEESA